MKISVDDQELFSLSETQKKVIMNDIPEDIFEADMKRRLEYILLHKYEQCFKRLKSEWCDGDQCRLAKAGIESIPTDPVALAELIFAQPEYKSRKMRDEADAEKV